ncbi:MAG: hypothetical protein ACJAT7_002346, partial [Psychromonas sp.]
DNTFIALIFGWLFCGEMYFTKYQALTLFSCGDSSGFSPLCSE